MRRLCVRARLIEYVCVAWLCEPIDLFGAGEASANFFRAGAYSRWKYPFGHRTCRFLCTTTALQAYARDHEGWFPSSLESLYPKYLEYEGHLAGLSGDESSAVDRLRAGLALDAKASGWVYRSDLRVDDDSRVAVIWDRTPGLGMGGGRSTAGIHVVGFVDLSYKVIPENDWPRFLQDQEALRSDVLRNRRTQAPPDGPKGVVQ
jgi:hypothetical protein